MATYDNKCFQFLNRLQHSSSIKSARSASWTNGNAFVSGLRDLRFKSDTVLTTGRLHDDISLKKVVLPADAMTRKWALQTCYTLRCNAANTIKDLFEVKTE